ncbi:uncharacterized protein [Blastocystis hominis]|uniref:Ubiquitin-like domain-containing protein n=1 Tax=Blastocystis hominis TaxID=12968 RepID=D8M602_BLAHO|nr:uncharacterized protein [Blastocystis hominis]CBK23601.2 unnamed protein product [Blastocystis hominis]|eukprot:XP_012897649.1 uncharacterized protein [Blastocystis hominis]
MNITFDTGTEQFKLYVQPSDSLSMYLEEITTRVQCEKADIAFTHDNKRVQTSKPIMDWISDKKTVCILMKYTYTIQWKEKVKRIRSYTNIRVSRLVQECVTQFKLSNKPISMYILKTANGRMLESSSTLPFCGISMTLSLVCVESVEISVNKDKILLSVKVNPFATVRDLVKYEKICKTDYFLYTLVVNNRSVEDYVTIQELNLRNTDTVSLIKTALKRRRDSVKEKPRQAVDFMELPELSDGSSNSNSESDDSQQSISSELSYSSLDYEETANEKLRMIGLHPSTLSSNHLDSTTNVPKAEAGKRPKYENHKQKAAIQESDEDNTGSLNKKHKEDNKKRVQDHNGNAEFDSLIEQHSTSSLVQNSEESNQSMLSFSVFAESEEIPLTMEKTDTIAQLIMDVCGNDTELDERKYDMSTSNFLYIADETNIITVQYAHDIIQFVLTEKLTLRDILSETDYPSTGQLYIKGVEKPLKSDVPLVKQGVENKMELEYKDTEIKKEIHLYEGDKLIALQYEPEKTVSDIIESYLALKKVKAIKTILKQTVLTIHKQFDIIENSTIMKDIDSQEFDVYKRKELERIQINKGNSKTNSLATEKKERNEMKNKDTQLSNECKDESSKTKRNGNKAGRCEIKKKNKEEKTEIDTHAEHNKQETNAMGGLKADNEGHKPVEKTTLTAIKILLEFDKDKKEIDISNPEVKERTEEIDKEIAMVKKGFNL